MARRSARGVLVALKVARLSKTLSREQAGQQGGQLWARDVAGELGVLGGRLRVPEVLGRQRNKHLVEQRVAQARDLDERAEVRDHAVVATRPTLEDPDLLAAGRGPHPYGAGAACGCLAVVRQQVHGHLHRQGVHVDAGRRVHAGGHGGQTGRRPAGVVALERAEVAEVEHGAEVDVEALGALAGEGLDAVAERADGVGGQGGVARRGERADVARRAGQSGPELGRPAVMPVDHLQAVGLHPVPVRARQRRDGPDVVEEEARVAQRRR